jgi:hypothetical protein
MYHDSISLKNGGSGTCKFQGVFLVIIAAGGIYTDFLLFPGREGVGLLGDHVC